MNQTISASIKELLKSAIEAQKNSHSPYSNCAVGAALRTKDGKIYSGCNIENASYGGTVCAERVAILKARSEGPIEIKELLCITESNPPWPPCGMCLQVITEFAKPNALIHIANNEGVVNTLTLEDLLPKAFSAEHLHTHLGRK